MNFNKTLFTKNKLVIGFTAAIGLSVIGSYYYYYYLGKKELIDSTLATFIRSKKKKHKKKKGKNETKSLFSSDTIDINDTDKKKIFTISLGGEIEISKNALQLLTSDEIEEYALKFKEEGNNEFKNKNYESAIQYYTAAIKMKSDPIFFSNRSACYSALNQHHNVIRDTTQAINLKPNYTKCILRRANSYEILEQYEEAMIDLTALTIYGGFTNKSIEQILERVLRKHSIKIINSLPKEYNLPSSSTIGSFFGAFTKDDYAHILTPLTIEGNKYLYDAIILINNNIEEDYGKADELVSQAIKCYNIDNLDTEPENIDAIVLGLQYSSSFKFLKSDTKNAFEDIEKSIQLKPNAKSYIIRALINADKSLYSDAFQDFENAEKLDPNNSDIFYHLGQLYYLTNDLTNAKIKFLKSKELNPNNIYVFIQLACITYKLGSIQEANEKFTEAKLKFPTSPEVPNYYGEILAHYGDIKGACRQFDIAIRLQESLPNFSIGALPLINKATCLSKDSFDDIDQAEKLLIEACNIDKKSELAKISLGQIKLHKDQVDEAIKLFEESSRLARTFEEKVQTTSFAEATKMQKKIKNDPILTKKLTEVMEQNVIMS